RSLGGGGRGPLNSLLPDIQRARQSRFLKYRCAIQRCCILLFLKAMQQSSTSSLTGTNETLPLGAMCLPVGMPSTDAVAFSSFCHLRHPRGNKSRNRSI